MDKCLRGGHSPHHPPPPPRREKSPRLIPPPNGTQGRDPTPSIYPLLAGLSGGRPSVWRGWRGFLLGEGLEALVLLGKLRGGGDSPPLLLQASSLCPLFPTCAGVYLRGMSQRMPGRVKRKRARLFTQAELARALGVSRSTVQRIEAAPFPPELLAYLRLVGYRVTFNPVRKERE